MADGCETARIGWSATSLGQDRLALVLAEPIAEVGEGVCVVGGAGGVGSGVVGIEILVDVKNEVGSASVKVCNLDQGGAGTVRDKGACRSEVCAGKEDLVASCASLADGSNGSLNSGSPGVDVKVMLE